MNLETGEVNYYWFIINHEFVFGLYTESAIRKSIYYK